MKSLVLMFLVLCVFFTVWVVGMDHLNDLALIIQTGKFGPREMSSVVLGATGLLFACMLIFPFMKIRK